MHILLGLLSVIGAIAFFLWRINMAGKAASELADTAGELANLPRKMRFKSKAGKRGIDVIEDPREAAAALVYGAIASGDYVTAERKAALAASLAEVFEVSEEEAKELVARAAWHVTSLNDPINAVNPLTDRLIATVGRDPMADLKRLMDAEAARNERPSSDQRYFIDKFARRAGLG
ncbi:MAG: hypothetical protein RKE49_03300 [Oceanicaulis sp.]